MVTLRGMREKIFQRSYSVVMGTGWQTLAVGVDTQFPLQSRTAGIDSQSEDPENQ